MEGALRGRELRHAFLLELTDTLLAIADPAEIQAAAARGLGLYLGADRAFYGDVEADGGVEHVIVRHEYRTPKMPSAVGRHPVASLDDSIIAAAPEGHSIAASDPGAAPGRDAKEPSRRLAIDACAPLVVRVVTGGRLVALLAVYETGGRAWADDEVALAQETAERTWTAVERARDQGALRRSEARYRALFEASDEGMCLFERLPARADGRRDYRYIAMNAAMQAMFGIRDLTGQSIRDNFPDEVEDWYDDYDRVLETGRPLRFERESAPQGLVLEMFVTRLEDESGRRLLAVMRDVTARTRAERALLEGEARQAFLLRFSDALRPLADPAAIRSTACRLLAEHLDVACVCCVEAGEAASVDGGERDSASGPVRAAGGAEPADFAWLLPALRPGACVVVSDTRTADVVPPAGRAFTAARGIVACIGTPLFETGRLVAALWVAAPQPRPWTSGDVALVRDAADRLWAAADRARADETLRRTADQLTQADQRKDEFLAMLAHELRNPLAPIRTGLGLIRIAGKSPATMERVLGMMERQVGHMVRLVDDLLDVSRITSGKMQLQRQPTPLRSLVNGAIDTHQAAIAAKGIQLTVELPERLCVLDVDPTRFMQVVANLLHNATKFTDAGGSIRVVAQLVECPPPRPAELSLSVIDNGAGIPPALLPRVFDLFTQGHQASSQPGLGIGLALARRLVEMHGGRIEVRSEGEQQGSQFVIRLPVSAAAPQGPLQPAATLPNVDCRVMVIDDNRDAATALGMLIEELGGECRLAFDGESGLREILAYRPHVVLLDIGMPGLDGYETCRRIRRELGTAVSVVAVTGFGQEHDRNASLRAGFDQHLTKPADPAAVAELLTRYRRQHTGGGVVP